MSNVVLVTGVMGSGKTLKVVADLVNDIEKNETRPVEEKRTYYADIHRHTGGLEKLGGRNTTFITIHRHTGGLEMF